MLDHSSQLDGIFQALSDPTRRAIVEQLGMGPKSVSEIAAPLDMTLAAVVQHVQLLENCQLITTQKHGRVRTCKIVPQTLQTIDAWLNQRRRQWEQHFDRLAAVLDEQSPKRKRP
jgi:DNA-binding transcriptional ArsR family regulator